MKKFYLFALVILIFLVQLSGCKSNIHGEGEEEIMNGNLDKMIKVYKNITKYYYDEKTNLYYETNIGKLGLDQNKYSFLWPVAALMQAYVEMAKLDINNINNKLVLISISDTAQKYYDSLLPPKPGYDSYVYNLGGGQRYYDDNEWLGIAFVDIYSITKNVEYLKKAEEIFNFIMTGYDNKMGGGIYWREGDLTVKNTCSNGPAVVLALKLYQTTNQQEYLNIAKEIYNWTNENFLSPEGVYWDHLKSDGTLDKTTWTYNTGIMIEANALFYDITKDKVYFDSARKLAEASIKHFASNGYFPDTYWFNAVLLRGYQSLYQIDKDKKYIKIFDDYAQEVWEKERDENNLIGKKEPKPLLDQAAMLEIYARLAQVEGGGNASK
ncbi:glycoside hydrolase family 76 protein [Thermoanaerobacter uzonensis]|uniref:glycoside hydrolase family 76 protein n=1 Tax=Thermoanaerobacter uzonensis TaxID=447593 RepID=UPI003D768C60